MKKKRKENPYKRMWARKELDLIQNFKNIVMDWIVIPFGGKKIHVLFKNKTDEQVGDSPIT